MLGHHSWVSFFMKPVAWNMLFWTCCIMLGLNIYLNMRCAIFDSTCWRWRKLKVFSVQFCLFMYFVFICFLVSNMLHRSCCIEHVASNMLHHVKNKKSYKSVQFDSVSISILFLYVSFSRVFLNKMDFNMWGLMLHWTCWVSICGVQNVTQHVDVHFQHFDS